jgi:hypothetical protein
MIGSKVEYGKKIQRKNPKKKSGRTQRKWVGRTDEEDRSGRRKRYPGYFVTGACGNAGIAAHGENLWTAPESPLSISELLPVLAHRFPPIAWKSPRGLSHNPLDNSPLRYELPTFPQALLLLDI